MTNNSTGGNETCRQGSGVNGVFDLLGAVVAGAEEASELAGCS